MKKFFVFILSITAFLLVATAGFYSVFGLSKLFIGASTAVILMAGTLEFSKVVIVSFLHQYWEKINFLMRIYLMVAIVALMAITSAGIYGFLSSAYSQTSTELSQVTGVIEIKQKDIDSRNVVKLELNKQIETKRKRIASLTALRSQQEIRIDSLYNKGWFQSAKRTEKAIEKSNDNIEKLSDEIKIVALDIKKENDSISKLQNYIVKTKNEKILGEVGPLKYVANITGESIDGVVNWLILLFIFLIDPLAILFIISASLLIKIIKEESSLKLKKNDGSETKKEEIAEDIVKEVADEVIKETVEEVEEVAEEVTEEVTEEIVEEIVEEVKVASSIIEFPLPQEKQEMIAYKTNAEGEFEKEISNKTHIKIDGDKIVEGIYTAKTRTDKFKLSDASVTNLVLLDEIYENGKKQIGDEIMTYDEIKNILRSKKINFDKNYVMDFISIIVLLHVVHKKHGKLVIAKKFENAKEIIKKI